MDASALVSRAPSPAEPHAPRAAGAGPPDNSLSERGTPGTHFGYHQIQGLYVLARSRCREQW